MLDEIINIVKACGEKMLSAENIENYVDEKSGEADFVTKYDNDIERYLKEELMKLIPEANFLGEEEAENDKIDKGYGFVVDPIDGTTNFIKHFSHSAVSVAVSYDGEPVLGVVYNPYLKDLFYAEKGKGAWLNGKRIKVSEHGLHDGIVIFGSSPYYPETTERTFSTLRKVFEHSLDCRRTGSAALDMCYAACGKCDLYFEVRVSPWDYGAACLILSESGGVSSTMDGENIKLPYGEKTSVVAGSKKAFSEYWKLMKE